LPGLIFCRADAATLGKENPPPLACRPGRVGGEIAIARRAEIEAAERHSERLREGRPETLETTSLHLDILRDLKRIHSHICAAAYAAINSTAGAPTDEATDSGPITLSTSRSGPGVE
jgi:hypothetical protein